MSKTDLKLTMDKQIKTKMKQSVPNLSKFTEDMYKAYLYSGNDTEDTLNQKIQEEETRIKEHRAILSIYLSRKEALTNEDKKTDEAKNIAWRNLYNHYDIFDNEYYKEVLGLTDEELENIRLKCNTLIDRLYDEHLILKIKTDYNTFLEQLKKEGMSL